MLHLRISSPTILLLCFVLAISRSDIVLAADGFDLDVSVFGFSKSQREAFAAAEAFWEEVIVGYAPNITQTTVAFTARKHGLDGPDGVLGQAGPSGTVTQGGYVLSTGGSMTIDSADIDLLTGDGKLVEVIKHEIGHILGIGTLWTHNGLYVNGTGRYTGALGLAAYQQEFDPRATFVPVELGGGAGTANGHWDELYGVTDPLGRPLSEELMTGYLGEINYLSQTTIQSLRDLGFVVAEPEVAPPPTPGDFNNDGLVDLADYIVWRNNLGITSDMGINNAGDGQPGVNASDYAVWKSNFGSTGGPLSSPAAVPEPMSCGMLALGLICVLTLRRA